MIISMFKSTYHAYVTEDTQFNFTWDNIAEILTDHEVYKNKVDAPMFNLWEFNLNGKPGKIGDTIIQGSSARCKENALKCYGLVLDYDGGKSILDVMEDLDGLEFILYTTFNHLSDGKTEKFRVVLPFSTPATLVEMMERQYSIAKVFTGVDTASFTPSQAFYTYSSPPNAKHEHYRCKGKMLDIMCFKAIKIKPVVINNQPPTNNQPNPAYKKAMIDSLSTCSGLHYSSDKSKYGIIMLITLLKSVGATYNEYEDVLNKIIASDSCLHDSKKRESIWNDTPTPIGVTKNKRDEFIQAYNGENKFTYKKEGYYKILGEIREGKILKMLKKYETLIDKYNIT